MSTIIINGNGTLTKGNGNIQLYDLNEELSKHDLTQLILAGAINVHLNVEPNCKENQLLANVESNIFPLLDIINKNGKLTIGFKHDTNISTKNNIEIVLQVPSLESLSIVGSGDIKGNYFGSRLQTNISGSGDIQLYGNVENLEAQIQGSGDLKLKNLTAQNANLTVIGSGDISISVIQAANAKIMGSGDINIFGTTLKINKQVMGSGDVNVNKNYIAQLSSFNFNDILKNLKNPENTSSQSHNKNSYNDITKNQDGSISATQISNGKNTLIIDNNNFDNFNNRQKEKESLIDKIKKFF